MNGLDYWAKRALDAEAEVARLHVENKKIAAREHELRETIVRLEVVRDSLAADVARLKAENAVLEKKLTVANYDLDNANEAVDKLQADAALMKSRIAELEARDDR